MQGISVDDLGEQEPLHNDAYAARPIGVGKNALVQKGNLRRNMIRFRCTGWFL